MIFAIKSFSATKPIFILKGTLTNKIIPSEVTTLQEKSTWCVIWYGSMSFENEALTVNASAR